MQFAAMHCEDLYLLKKKEVIKMENEKKWGWVELKHGRKTNGYRLEQKTYTLLFAENVRYNDAPLKDGKYYVTAYVVKDDKEEEKKDKLRFKDGYSKEGLVLGRYVDKSQIKKAGVSIPPDY